MIEFFVPATLRTKGNSMEIRRRGRKTWISPTDEQKAAENFVRMASLQHAPREPLTGSLRMDVTFMVKVPKSYKGAKLAEALCGMLRPDTPDKGDRGNHLKLLEDALEGVFYVNDAQICAGDVSKMFGRESGYFVRIEELHPIRPEEPGA